MDLAKLRTRAIQLAESLLAVHDKPARIEGQRVVGRLEGQVPGPIVESVPRRDWFPM